MPDTTLRGPDRLERTRCLVTGATGAVGPALVRRLVQENHEVRVLSHRVPVRLPAVQTYAGDLADRYRLRAALEGVHIVFHLAAKLHVHQPSAALRAEYERVNVDGTRCLVETAAEAGVARVVFFSTIAVYGASRPGEILDERSPLRPSSLYAETKVRAEQIVLAGLSGVVLRLAAVYGPYMKGNYRSLACALQSGRFVPVGAGTNRRTLVYEDDVAQAALLAAHHPAAAGQVYNVTDGAIYSLNQIITAVCQSLGRPVPHFHLPISPVRACAGIIEDITRPFGAQPLLTRALVDKLVEDIAVSSERVQQALRFQPCYSLDSGWASTIAAWADHDLTH